MPTYVCSAATGRLTSDQKAEIARKASVRSIIEETGAPRYLVQVIFYDVAPGSQYIAGRPWPADQIWVRGDIGTDGPTSRKTQKLHRMMQDVRKASGAAEETVWVYLADISAENIVEYGRVLLPPGSEEAWLATLPDDLREKLRSLA